MKTTETEAVVKRSTRCSACKLPLQTLVELHRDRHENLLSFEALAAKYNGAERPLSETGLRRHFKAHVGLPAPVDREVTFRQLEEAGTQVPTNGYASLLDGVVDPELVLREGVLATLRELARCDNEARTARLAGNPIGAERSLAKTVRLKDTLVRELRELAVARKPRMDLGRIVFNGHFQAERFAVGRAQTLAKEHCSRVCSAMNEYLKTENPRILSRSLAGLEGKLFTAVRDLVGDVFVEIGNWIETEYADIVRLSGDPKKRRVG